MARTREPCGDLAVWPNQAATASAPVASHLGGLSLVRDTLELKNYTKLFHQTANALSVASFKMRHYTHVVCRFLRNPP